VYSRTGVEELRSQCDARAPYIFNLEVVALLLLWEEEGVGEAVRGGVVSRETGCETGACYMGVTEVAWLRYGGKCDGPTGG
jgi:hypothetical protein